MQSYNEQGFKGEKAKYRRVKTRRMLISSSINRGKNRNLYYKRRNRDVLDQSHL